MSLPSLVLRALALGLSTGLFCVGFCVPLLGPVVLSRQRRGIRESAAAIGLFLAGRLAAYLVFGLVFGALGQALAKVWSVRPVLLPALYCLLGLLMIVYGLVQSFPRVGLCRVLGPRLESRWALVVLGFLAGINLCPPFLLAVFTVVDLGGALRGMLFFFLFFLATSVYFVPLAFSGLVSRFAAVRFAARAAAVLAGVYFIWLGVRPLVGRLR